MAISSLILLLLLLTAAAYLIAKRRALQTVGGRRHASQLNSLPSHYGALAAIWCVVPALVLLLLWGVLEGPVIDRQVAAQLDPAKPTRCGVASPNTIAPCKTGRACCDRCWPLRWP